jgi:hypothetical protein
VGHACLRRALPGDDGLWLALPPNTGPNVSPTSVYFVPAGLRTVRVTALGARAAWWLAASGHRMWLATPPEAGSSDGLWTARGRQGKVRRLETVSFPAARPEVAVAACRTPRPGPGAFVYRRGYLYVLAGSPSVLSRVPV